MIFDDDIMKTNRNNSDITEISKITALLFHFCNLNHYYFYSGVGPGALLQLQLIISQLYAFKLRYSVQKMVDHYTLL